MEKPRFNIVSLSGGKDSTAMLLKMIEQQIQIDCILFCDTGLEFPAMYSHLDKLERDIGLPITRIKAAESYEYYMFETPVNRKKVQLFQRSMVSLIQDMDGQAQECDGVLHD